MTTTIISATFIGAGIPFNYVANGHQLIILQNVTLGSTNSAAVGGLGFDDLALTILGSIAGTTSLAVSGSDAVITIAAGGSFVSSEDASGNSGFFLAGELITVTNHGNFLAPTAIGILSTGVNEIVNTGTMQASSAVFLGLNDAIGDVFVNSGSVVSNSYDDAVNNIRFNNGVVTEGANTRITNLTTGSIMAVATEAAGVRFHGVAGGVHW